MAFRGSCRVDADDSMLWKKTTLKMQSTSSRRLDGVTVEEWFTLIGWEKNKIVQKIDAFSSNEIHINSLRIEVERKQLHSIRYNK